MIPWDVQFVEQQARVIFGANRLTLEWQVGTAMPLKLPSEIAKAVVERQQTNHCAKDKVSESYLPSTVGVHNSRVRPSSDIHSTVQRLEQELAILKDALASSHSSSEKAP